MSRWRDRDHGAFQVSNSIWRFAIKRAVFRSAIAAFMGVVAGPVNAEPQPSCVTTLSGNWCVPLLSCIGEDGLWFKGQAYGWRSGPVTGTLSNGAACTGNWARLSDNRGGMLRVDCEGGHSATIVFQYDDPATGTVIAKGITKSGEPVVAWAGLYVPIYLRDVAGMPSNTLVCGTHEIPLS